MKALMSISRNLLAGAAVLVATAVAAAAQGQQTGAMPGLTSNRDQPVKIESTTLEVRDKKQEAMFIGDVKLTQGDTVIRCNTLVVFYEDSSAQSASAKSNKPAATPAMAAPGAPGGQAIKRVEALGNVIVTQKDQTASGEKGVFDMKANTITLTGNVVVTQGPNVMRGAKMVVNLTTGLYVVESSNPTAKAGSKGAESSKPGRVEVMIIPGQTKGMSTPSGPASPAPASPPAKSSSGPMRIN
jgi:lipopolysaccharide export system protein LptA